MTDWVRLWHDMPTDPKWRTIARKSGQRIGDVIAVFSFVMINASANESERGTLRNLVIEDVAAALDMDDADVSAIIDAMQGRVIDNNRLTGWEKRQPKREDGTAQARKAAWTERQKEKRNATERNGTQCNAPETETETDKIEAKASVDLEIDRASIDEVVGAWNDLAKHIDRPAIRKLTPARRQAVRARIAGYSLDDWRAVMGKIEQSPFLSGKRDWPGVTFDWIIKDGNFLKILEGNYDDKPAYTPTGYLKLAAAS